MDDQSQHALVRLLEPAPVSFETFFDNEHEGQIRRSFLLLGNSSDAADATAEAFAKVFERWDRIDEPGPYLNRCVLNACHDRARRRTRQRAERLAVPNPAPPDTDAIELADLLLALPFRQRSAIVLRFYGGFTEVEIASALGCRPGTVGPLIHRGLKKLKMELS